MPSDFLKQYSSTSQPKPLTKRGQERRLALLTTAYNLFVEHGYDDVSLDNIIQITGGSKTSIYQYFGDKEGLFKAVCDYHFSQKAHRFILPFHPDDDLKHYLKQLLLSFYQELDQNKDAYFFHAILQQSRHSPKLISELYQRWCNEVQKKLADIFSHFHQKQLLNCPNPLHSAMLFWGIVHDIRWKHLTSLPLDNLQDFTDYIDYSINIFLAGHQYRG